MPGIDHSLPVRKAALAYLKADPVLQAIVADRIYPEKAPTNPVWPFIRYGVAIMGEFEASCWEGSEGEVVIHAFAKGPGDEGILNLAAAIVERMKGFTMSGPIQVIDFEWAQTQLIRDTDEADAYHAAVQFRAATVETVN